LSFGHGIFVVLGVIASGILWPFLRYSFVSVVISNAVVFLVVWLKWPTAIGSAIYLFIHYQPTAAVIALIWPLVAACTSPKISEKADPKRAGGV
jgi:hypothetical protein